MAPTMAGEMEEPGFGKDRDQANGRNGSSRKEWQLPQDPDCHMNQV